MSAFLPFLEDEQSLDAAANAGEPEQTPPPLGEFSHGPGEPDDGVAEIAILEGADGPAQAFGKPAAERDVNADLQTTVEANHASLTRFVWNRSLVEEHLRTARVWLEVERGKGYVFKIDPPLPPDVIPWKRISGAAGRDTFRLFGDDNAKMACPTWDLPAGAPVVGGTCPGAVAAQTVVPRSQREQHLDEKLTHLRLPSPGVGKVPFHEARSICAFCYAGEGNYGYGEKFAEGALRLWWTKELLATPAGTDEWVNVMAGAILSLSIPVTTDCYSDEQIRPIRVHSAGDFYAPKYAEAWVRVANAVGKQDPLVRFWCPTRTWEVPGAGGRPAFDWPRILSNLDRNNLLVRPSAYHVGDASPEGLTAEDAPGYARGTTALVAPPEPGKKPGLFVGLFPEAVWTGPDDDRRDYDCPVYALKKADEEGSCAAANCRVCWTRPDVRVNYALH